MWRHLYHLVKVPTHLVGLEIAEHEIVRVPRRVLEQLDKLVGRQVGAVLLGQLLQNLLVLGAKQEHVRALRSEGTRALVGVLDADEEVGLEVHLEIAVSPAWY